MSGSQKPAPAALPELLAPAGSPEAFRAAIAAGADAVYLSGRRFGARKYAANFTDEEIANAIAEAHAHGIRVYVTVNTLVHDRELPGVAEYLAWLWSAGADAVLVQDMAVAALAREYAPGLVLHASTQLTIHNADGVSWAHEQGFSRVVLARELSLAEVERIAEATRDTGIGLEVFAHGALCYGYSGQCLLSSVIGGRSGNRGMCAQPCRKPYALVTGEADRFGRPTGTLSAVPGNGKYLLSPRDLCTYPRLDELARSPVVSLKIEGRMKSPAYVATVVSAYREALDAIATGSWKPSEAAQRDLVLAFSRGFSAGYLFGERYEQLMGRDAPDNRGLLIGKVTAFDRKASAAVVRPTVPVVPVTGDGLLVTHPDAPGKDCGFALNTVPVSRGPDYLLPLPAPVLPRARVYLTSSRELEARARHMAAKPSPLLLRPIPVDLAVGIAADGRVRLHGTVVRPDGRTVPVVSEPSEILEPARTRPLAPEQLEAQFRKSGDTPFFVRTFSLEYAGGLAAPVALLNAMRREFFARALRELSVSYLPPPEATRQARALLKSRPVLSPKAGTPALFPHLRLVVWTDSEAGVREAVAAGADTVCYEPLLQSPSHACGSGAETEVCLLVLSALETCRAGGALLVWKLPRILHDADLEAILPGLAVLGGQGLAACMTDDRGASRAVRRTVPAMAVHGSSGLNIFNHRAFEQAGNGYATLTLSPELSLAEIGMLAARAGTLKGAPLFDLVVEGNAEALITEDCIPRLARHCRAGEGGGQFMGIRDETGRIFPVRSDGSCRTRIANAAETCLIGQLDGIQKAGISGIVIDARGRPPAYAGAMTALYRKALAAHGDFSAVPEPALLATFREQAASMALGGITSGHLPRGLKE